jgi:uncharacterized membrane-anchored protein
MRKVLLNLACLIILSILALNLYSLAQVRRYSDRIENVYYEPISDAAFFFPVETPYKDDISLHIGQNLVFAHDLSSLQYLTAMTNNQKLVKEAYLSALNIHRGIVLKAAMGEVLTDLEKSQFNVLKEFWLNWKENSLDSGNSDYYLEALRDDLGNNP